MRALLPPTMLEHATYLGPLTFGQLVSQARARLQERLWLLASPQGPALTASMRCPLLHLTPFGPSCAHDVRPNRCKSFNNDLLHIHQPVTYSQARPARLPHLQHLILASRCHERYLVAIPPCASQRVLVQSRQSPTLRSCPAAVR